MVKDVCAECNNNRISYIDSYARHFIGQYFTKKYSEGDVVEIEYDFTMVQKMLLKYAFNDMRSHKADCSFFDNEMLSYLLNESDNAPKANVTILCGLAVNVSPVPDALFGNLKLRWCKDPVLYASSTVQSIDYETGQVKMTPDVSIETFPDLKVSYLFRFNSVQFLLMCWDKDSDKIEQNNIVLGSQYPYYVMKPNEATAVLPISTNEINYHRFEQIHVSWDGLFEVGLMRRIACGGKYPGKEAYEKEWEKEEENLKKQHQR